MSTKSRVKHRPEWYEERRRRFMPDGVPRYVRCYDNGGETIDRYTVVFTGRYGHRTGWETWILSMSAAPFHPQGVGLHSAMSNMERPDVGPGSWGGPSIGRRCHLGVRIKFEDLPEDCRKCVLQDYKYLWDLTSEEHPMARDPFDGDPLPWEEPHGNSEVSG